MKFPLRFVFVLTAFFLLSGCKKQQSYKILRLAHGLNTDHPIHGAMEYLGQQLHEKSGGSLRVKVYPGAQLGAERECLELLQIGSLDITKVSAAVLENFVPEYKILSIPYIFESKEHYHTIYDGPVGREFLLKGEQFRLRGLAFYDAGSRSFYTKEKPIETPEDLAGLKIRVQKSNMAVAMVKLLGGAATPISYGELYTALQQGVVDGAENNLPSFFTSKHYEVCKYYSIDEHTAVPDVLLIGTESWSRLNEQEQRWLEESARESVIYQRKAWEKAEQIALNAIKEAGVLVNYPEKGPFSEKTEDIYEMFKDEAEIIRLIEAIKQGKP